MRYNAYSYYLLLITVIGSLGLFGAWALFSPVSLMKLIGYQATGPFSIIEFQSFYGGLELGIAAFLLLPTFLVGHQQKIAACACTFGFTGLSRLFGMLSADTFPTALLSFAAIEIGILLWAAMLIYCAKPAIREEP